MTTPPPPANCAQVIGDEGSIGKNRLALGCLSSLYVGGCGDWGRRLRRAGAPSLARAGGAARARASARTRDARNATSHPRASFDGATARSGGLAFGDDRSERRASPRHSPATGSRRRARTPGTARVSSLRRDVALPSLPRAVRSSALLAGRVPARSTSSSSRHACLEAPPRIESRIAGGMEAAPAGYVAAGPAIARFGQASCSRKHMTTAAPTRLGGITPQLRAQQRHNQKGERR